MNDNVDRRTLLKALAASMGATIAAPVLSAVNTLAATDYSTDLAQVNQGISAFNEKQFALMKHLTEMIIPETDTPGAIAAGVPAFIDRFVSEFYSEADRKTYFQGMRLLEHHCLISFKKEFLACSDAQQQAALSDAESNQLGTVNDSLLGQENDRESLTPQSWTLWGDRPEAGENFFRQMKSMTILGYYTSEVGATQALIYDPVPGFYDGDVDFYEKKKHYTS